MRGQEHEENTVYSFFRARTGDPSANWRSVRFSQIQRPRCAHRGQNSQLEFAETRRRDDIGATRAATAACPARPAAKGRP